MTTQTPGRGIRGEDGSAPARLPAALTRLVQSEDARLIAWIVGLSLGAILCMIGGDFLHQLATGAIR